MKTKTLKRNLLVIHFSGHGELVEEEKEEEYSFYICPYIFKESNAKETGIRVFELRDLICTLDNIHCLVILDCCFGGSSFGKKRNPKEPPFIENFMINHFGFFFKKNFFNLNFFIFIF